VTNALKFLYFAGTLIITCMLLSVGFSIFHKIDNVSKNVIKDLNEEAIRFEEGKFIAFDNNICQGYEVINLLNREFSGTPAGKKGEMYIKVVSRDRETVYSGSEYLSDIRNPESDKYIRPLAEYYGSIVRDKNNSIIGIEFVEMVY